MLPMSDKTGIRNAKLLGGLTLIALVSFFSQVVFAASGTEKFDSPDETMNYVVTLRYAQGEDFVIEEELQEVSGLLIPRGFGQRPNAILPGSFLGLPLLYGSLGRILGPGILPVLTPLLSAFALFAFFFLVRNIFGNGTAMIAVLLLAIHPAFWYYSSRGFYHNALFFDFLIIGLWAVFRLLFPPDVPTRTRGLIFERARTRRWKNSGLYGLAGFSIGAALAVRSSEILWIVGVLCILVVTRWRRIDFRFGLWVGIVGFALALAPVLLMNAKVFGQPLAFAYAQGAVSTSSIQEFGVSLWEKISKLLFPFGFSGGNIIRNTWTYGIALFWWLSIPSILGFLLIAKNLVHLRLSREEMKRVVYGSCYVFIVFWLVFFYGPWNIQDNLDPNKVTIGTSYVRYWLPMYGLGLPFAAYVLLRLSRHLFTKIQSTRTRRMHTLFPASFVGVVSLLMLSLSFSTTVRDPVGGLAVIHEHALKYRRLADSVQENTPPESVILSGSADKIFFPERRVIVSVRGDDERERLGRVLERVPVYLYLSPLDEPVAFTRLWEERGFSLTNPVTLSDNEILYKLEHAPPQES